MVVELGKFDVLIEVLAMGAFSMVLMVSLIHQLSITKSPGI